MKPEKDNQNKLSKKDSPDNCADDEAFVERRLELLGQPEPIDPQFIESLSERLDAEFASANTGGEVSVDAETENSCSRRTLTATDYLIRQHRRGLSSGQRTFLENVFGSAGREA